MPPAELPPDNVVEAFRPEEATAVVPQPRYPEEPSSRISNGPSDPAPAAAGRDGSLLGLYPYSSTSFRLISSASLRCFRLRQKKIIAAAIKATATMGTTTATAMVPPLDRDLLLPPLFWLISDAEVVEDDEDEVVPEVPVFTAAAVDVIT